MWDIMSVVEALNREGALRAIGNNPLAQFGPPTRRYLGAELLPEKTVPENGYTETQVRYRSVIANDGTRYSPVQLKGNVLSGSVEVNMGYSDIGSQITGSDYDALIKLINAANSSGGDTRGDPARDSAGFSFEASKNILNFAELALNRPLVEKNEKMRWEAIVDAVIVRTGDDNFRETVNLPNPTGQRVNAAGVWSNNAYDPYTDIVAGMDYLTAKGYKAFRLIMGTPVKNKLLMNTLVKTRTGRIAIPTAGVITGLPGRVSLAELNAMFAEDDVPPIELYDLQYLTQTGSGWFLKRDVAVLVATTGREAPVDVAADATPLVLPNTLGYVAVGRPAGQTGPGRALFTRAITDQKPPRVEGEAWQASFPVILDPEAVYVIKNIT